MQAWPLTTGWEPTRVSDTSTKAEEEQVLTGGHDLVYAMDPTGHLMKPTDPFSENAF